MLDVVFVGHFAVDSIVLPRRSQPYLVLGGAAAYASLAAAQLGANVSVITKFGDDFPEDYLSRVKQAGIDILGVAREKNAGTTFYELRYNKDLSNRKLQLKKRAPPITINDLPESLEAYTIHIAPIAGEITYEVVKRLKPCAPQLSLDIQGLVREFNGTGEVSLGSLADREIFDLVDICKLSSEEAPAASGLSDLNSAIDMIHDYGVKTVIVTLGAEGAFLSVEGSRCKIPVFKSNRVVDPTGAGDVFVGSFLAERLRGKDLLWCACVGSAAASIVVESVGPESLGGKTEVHRRASMLYEKGIKR